MFNNTSPQNANLYLYEQPFVIPDIIPNRQQHLLEYLDDFDRQDEQKIMSHLLKFAINEKLVDLVDGVLYQSLNDDMGSWVWNINWMNFRSLVDMTQYGRLMSSLQAIQNYPINHIIELHVRLGSLFGRDLLNTLANRVISAVQLIPYDLKPDTQSTDWVKIHTETPFIWIVILLQNVIRSEAKKTRP